MSHQFIDENGGKSMAYDSLLVNPQKLSIFGSELCLKIVKELVKEPACAMDLARRLEQHEQKIYYHLRKLEDAGIIKQIRSEKRYSMTAKIYGVVSPIIATKLYEDGKLLDGPVTALNPRMEKVLHPFVMEGKLNAKVIFGDPYPHGKYDRPSRGGVHGFDFGIMLGKVLGNLSFPHYRFDVDVHAGDLEDNLIIFGSSKANTILERMNSKLPVYFDQEGGWQIVSKATGNRYSDPRAGFVMKWDNPLAEGKKVLVFGGVRTRGIQASVIAFTQHFDRIMEAVQPDGNFIRVVEGFDANGDKIIDSIKILE